VHRTNDVRLHPEPSPREGGSYYGSDLPSLTGYAEESRIAALSEEGMKKGVNPVVIGTRLRELREQKGLSQGDVERLTGIKRCYTSRVEHGHTVPGLENLERYATGLRVPMYRLFYEGDELPPLPKSTPRDDLQELEESKFFLKLRKSLAKVEEPDRGLFLAMAQRLVAAKR